MSVSITLPISNLIQSVQRPIVLGIIKDIQEKTQISHKTDIRFYGDDGKAMQIGSGFGDNHVEANKWPHRSNISIEVEHRPIESSGFTTAAHRAENPFCFHDPALGIYIKPVYTSTEVSIRVTYRAADQNEAIQWRNHVRSLFVRGQYGLMHTGTYSWHIPDAYIVGLKYLHTLRERQAGYNESFSKWAAQCLDLRSTVLTNQRASQFDLVIAEEQDRICGDFDFEVTPEKESREDDPNLWAISFEYKFGYSEPTNCIFHYPIVIHNQVIDDAYMNPQPSGYQSAFQRYSTSTRDLNKFESYPMALRVMGNRGINIPEYDTFSPTLPPIGTIRVATVLTLIEPSNKRLLFNLKEMGEYNFRQQVLDFISTTERVFVTKMLNSIIQLSLYEDRDILPIDALTIDADLNVIATRDLDLRKTYHVRIGLTANFVYLTEAALIRLKKNPLVACMLINAINLALTSTTFTPDIPHRRIPENHLHGIGLKYVNRLAVPIDADDEFYVNLRGMSGLQIALVETLFIRTERASE